MFLYANPAGGFALLDQAAGVQSAGSPPVISGVGDASDSVPSQAYWLGGFVYLFLSAYTAPLVSVQLGGLPVAFTDLGGGVFRLSAVSSGRVGASVDLVVQDSSGSAAVSVTLMPDAGHSFVELSAAFWGLPGTDSLDSLIYESLVYFDDQGAQLVPEYRGGDLSSLSRSYPVLISSAGELSLGLSVEAGDAPPSVFDLQYRANDASDGYSAGAFGVSEFDLTVPDTVPPVITLVGGGSVEVVEGATYVEPGFSAVDAEDGDLSAGVQVAGSVDVSAVGLYTLTYSVSDAAGNTATAQRVVSVVAAPQLLSFSSREPLEFDVAFYPAANDSYPRTLYAENTNAVEVSSVRGLLSGEGVGVASVRVSMVGEDDEPLLAETELAYGVRGYVGSIPAALQLPVGSVVYVLVRVESSDGSVGRARVPLEVMVRDDG